LRGWAAFFELDAFVVEYAVEVEKKEHFVLSEALIVVFVYAVQLYYLIE
jgi:hypothetical protein